MRFAPVLAATLLLAACATPQQPAPIASGAVPSQVPPAIEAQLQQIGRVVAPPQTATLYAPLQQKEPYAGVKVERDQRYGADARHLLDVFTPEAGGAARPAPTKPIRAQRASTFQRNSVSTTAVCLSCSRSAGTPRRST